MQSTHGIAYEPSGPPFQQSVDVQLPGRPEDSVVHGSPTALDTHGVWSGGARSATATLDTLATIKTTPDTILARALMVTSPVGLKRTGYAVPPLTHRIPASSLSCSPAYAEKTRGSESPTR
jgi:hypothetical protein